MSNITDLMNSFKDDVEKQEYIVKQQKVITNLLKEKQTLQKEIEHLKELLISNNNLFPTNNIVTTVIVTPEEGLIDRQIELIQNRGVLSELTLEDTKKLDLLLKNKNIIKEQNKPIKAESTKLDKKNLSNAQLIQIMSAKKTDGKD